MRARLISPISASNLVTALLREVGYPLGSRSTEVADPEDVVVPDICAETISQRSTG